jgi:hypothetical protein
MEPTVRGAPMGYEILDIHHYSAGEKADIKA